MAGLRPVRIVPLIFALLFGISVGALPHLPADNAPGYHFPRDALKDLQRPRRIEAVQSWLDTLLLIDGTNSLDEVMDSYRAA